MRPQWLLAMVVALVSGCAMEPPVPQAFFAIASNARSGDMRITAIDDRPISESNGGLLPAGSHRIKFACKLNNGISTTFATDVDFLPDHSYCFFSQNQGQSCNVMYTRIEWSSGAVAVCD